MSVKKKADAKEFFLNYGDRVALGVALTITVVIAFWGLSGGAPADPPTDSAVKQLENQARQHLNTGKSGDRDIDGTAAPKVALIANAANSAEYSFGSWFHSCLFPFAETRPLVENLAENPTVSQPNQLAALPLRTGFTVFDIRGDQVVVVKLKEGEIKLIDRVPDPVKEPAAYREYKLQERRNKLLDRYRKMGISPPDRMHPGDEPGGQPGGFPGGRPGGLVGPGGIPRDPKDKVNITLPSYTGTLKKFDEVGKDDALAVHIYPTWGIMVVGSFPLKEQMERLRVALRKPTIHDVPSVPTLVKGIEIQRRQIVPKGARLPDQPVVLQDLVWIYPDDNSRRELRPLASLREDRRDPAASGWTNVDLRESFDELRKTLDWEYEKDPIMKWIESASSRMLMKLPAIERGEYPEPAKQLAAINELIEKTKKQMDPSKPTGPVIDPRLLGEPDDDPFGAPPPPPGSMPPPAAFPGEPRIYQPSGDGRFRPVDGPGTPAGPDKSGKFTYHMPQWPDYTLIRFLDIDPRLEPGATYEYRIRVVLKNPNAGKPMAVVDPAYADVQEIRGEWSTETRVQLPEDLHLYADKLQKPSKGLIVEDHGRVAVQIHKWLGRFTTGSGQNLAEQRLADWYVLQTTAARGEYIGRVEKLAKMIVWDSTAPNPKSAHKFGNDVLIDGVVTDAFATGRILVDYSNGATANKLIKYKFTTAEDDVPVELLITEPDGRVVLKSSQKDRSDSDRLERFKKFNDWFKEVESSKNPPKPPK